MSASPLSPITTAPEGLNIRGIFQSSNNTPFDAAISALNKRINSIEGGLRYGRDSIRLNILDDQVINQKVNDFAKELEIFSSLLRKNGFPNEASKILKEKTQSFDADVQTVRIEEEEFTEAREEEKELQPLPPPLSPVEKVFSDMAIPRIVEANVIKQLAALAPQIEKSHHELSQWTAIADEIALEISSRDIKRKTPEITINKNHYTLQSASCETAILMNKFIIYFKKVSGKIEGRIQFKYFNKDLLFFDYKNDKPLGIWVKIINGIYHTGRFNAEAVDEVEDVAKRQKRVLRRTKD